MVDFKEEPEVTLKELFSHRFESQEKFILEKFRSLEANLDLSSKVLDERLHAMNQQKEIARQKELDFNEKLSSFMTRELYDTKHALLQQQVDDLMISRAELRGKASQLSVLLAYGIAFISLLLSVIGILHGFLKVTP